METGIPKMRAPFCEGSLIVIGGFRLSASSNHAALLPSVNIS